MFATAANFIIALIEQRPVAAGNILRDAGGPKAVSLNIQGLQKRLEEALERKTTEAQLELANSVMSEALRIEFCPESCEALVDYDTWTLGSPDQEGCAASTVISKIAEEAFELGRRSVEEIVEKHAARLAEGLEGMQKPKFLEVQVL